MWRRYWEGPTRMPCARPVRPRSKACGRVERKPFRVSLSPSIDLPTARWGSDARSATRAHGLSDCPWCEALATCPRAILEGRPPLAPTEVSCPTCKCYSKARPTRRGRHRRPLERIVRMKEVEHPRQGHATAVAAASHSRRLRRQAAVGLTTSLACGARVSEISWKFLILTCSMLLTLSGRTWPASTPPTEPLTVLKFYAR